MQKPENSITNAGLAEILLQQAATIGDAVAVEGSEYTLTYSQMLSKGLYVASAIQRRQENDQGPIGILIPRGINHVLAQVSVILSGRAFMPLDNTLPDHLLQSMLDNVHSTLLITTTRQDSRVAGIPHLVIDHVLDGEFTLDDFPPVLNDPSVCSHILHTSGTTGKPKAVQGLPRGLINLAQDRVDLVRAGQRVCHSSSITFDLSLMDIWGTFIRGATLVIIPTDTLLDPPAFAKFLKDRRIDALILTTSLLVVTVNACPDAFATVDTLSTGGEAINPVTIGKIFAAGPPNRIINVYGPTECSVLTIYHEVTEWEARSGRIPLGRPIQNIAAFLVDQDLRPVKEGEIGELILGGVCVNGGYLGESGENSGGFLTSAELARAGNEELVGDRFYRTGDLIRVNECGQYEYIGRTDNQVKIRGQRVELDALESNLLATGYVDAAVATKITPEEAENGHYLVAFCVPKSESAVDSATITRGFFDLAPHLMVPRVELVETLPLRSSGKVDRNALVQRHLQRSKELRARQSSDSVSAVLEGLIIDTLGLTIEKLLPSDNFLALGGNSLMVASLLGKIKRTLGVELRARLFHENSDFEQLVRLVEHLKQDGSQQDDLLVGKVLADDSRLAQDLVPIPGKVPVWQDDSEGRILLTGSTGFVGSFLLSSLLQRPDVKLVICLVRARDDAIAMVRVQDVLKKYRLNPDLSKLACIAGNLEEPKLGLSDEMYSFLAEQTSVVFHLGARVNYVEPYSSHRAANVLGTLNILEFANHKRPKALQYASSITVYGPTGYVTGTKFLPEDERPASHLVALAYDTGYAQSQFVAEQLVWSAIDNGLPAAIHRLGFVLGHSQTGVGNPDDFVGRVFASCMEMGSYPRLPNQRKEFVPVDFVVEAMLRISSSHQNHGHAYNIVHPNVRDAIDIQTSFEILQEVFSFQMTPMSYGDWMDQMILRTLDPLHPLLPMLKEVVIDGRTRWEAFENMPEHGRENLQRALQGAPDILDCPPISILFRKYINTWRSSVVKGLATSSPKVSILPAVVVETGMGQQGGLQVQTSVISIRELL